jgi:protease I
MMAGCLKEEATADLSGMGILLIVSEKDFRDSELTDPRDYFLKAGASVEMASTDSSRATGVGGLTLDPDLGLEEAEATDYDAVVFIGGPGSKTYLWESKAAADLAKRAYESGEVVAAICLSPVVLARAGILQGVSATGFDDVELKDELERAGATYTGSEVEVDGRIVTANGPGAAKEFAAAIAQALEG